MEIWSAQWSDWEAVHEEVVSTPREATDLIDRVARNSAIPTMVEFFNDRGTSFAIGIGRAKTVVTFQESQNPPYFISLGNANAVGTEWFCYGQEESEYLASNLVDPNEGRLALVEFIKKGVKPEVISWEKL